MFAFCHAVSEVCLTACFLHEFALKTRAISSRVYCFVTALFIRGLVPRKGEAGYCLHATLHEVGMSVELDPGLKYWQYKLALTQMQWWHSQHVSQQIKTNQPALW